ncbi:unnamed protein product [Rhodiola kirilowii]
MNFFRFQTMKSLPSSSSSYRFIQLSIRKGDEAWI